MSSSSVRRQRDLTACKQKPAKTPTPVSNTNPTLKKSSSGKENPRSSSLSRASVVTQKPMIRPVPRVEKAVAVGGSDGEGRVRLSTSSAPRGRSQSPSDFIRVFSDLKEDRVSVDSVSVDREKKGFRDSRVKGCKENGGFKESLVMKVKENEGKTQGVRVLDGNCKKDVKFNFDLGKSNGENIQNGVSGAFNEKSISDFDSKCDAKFLKEKSLSDGKCLMISKEDLSVQESGGSGAAIKYPSKLHEKLAFLEGKVKRIASDIKRTKEMLDKNNPDASKVILSDIQDKISGIEMAMGNVVTDSSGKPSGLKGSGDEDVGTKNADGSQSRQVGNVKISVKGLNIEELEARFFPHHKLLRNRTSLKESSGRSQSHESSKAVESGSELREEKKLPSPVEDNPIALEFLASLDKQSKVTMRNEQATLENCDIQDMDGGVASGAQGPLKDVVVKHAVEINLESDEILEEFDDQENRPTAVVEEESEDASVYQLNEIGCKTSTGGWFVSEGEAALVAHYDGSCSFYDVTNSEEKAVYKPPEGVSPNMWRDCWIIRAPSSDGCSGRYVVAASAGNSLESGFCSWDFYTKDVRAFHTECGETASRTILGPLPNNPLYRRNAPCNNLPPETQQWWYKPLGPLIISTASSQKVVKVYDIRDGEEIMKWEVQRPVLSMDYSSPLQWRNRVKVVVAETEMISVWDVNSLHPQTVLSVSSSGRKISALHINNIDAEIGGGVRQRVSSAEAEGNDGVFCTADSINILDFRHPSGIGARIAKVGVNVQSVSSRGDSIYLGCTNLKPSGQKQPCSQVQQFSLRKQRLFATYSLPEYNVHSHYSAITQVWGNSNLVMGVCALGLFIFDALKDDGLQPFMYNNGSAQNVREIVGPDDMYAPSFDYLASRVLLISRDRPALWRYLS
ncbi:putative plastid-lipid-associated protein 6 [Hibiscus syriacus]|uniref:Plastid-lipid-associated protein 6 n=1 Tax=Hibiscus syriacus TaxID=106335 RepID=A0A6A3BFK0_HIBSY|nr:KIN14B-interacting protein At4g14310-like [Hibiscus syriacus]KAE8714641.1 putative plastid-lipid-associated protein 6 [Hibiscus syriacus]